MTALNVTASKVARVRARQSFEAACGVPTTSFENLPGSAAIAGVGFFDVIHGQTGVPPNGINLCGKMYISGP